MSQNQSLPDKSSLPPVNAEELTHLYREMLLIRRVEELAAKAYTQRKILGFCHLYIGQESVAVGAAVSTKDDYWMAAYREHGPVESLRHHLPLLCAHQPRLRRKADEEEG